ncbi:MAG: phosphoribosylglycinamide formyltransferase [Chloroflexota bacterium]|nr:phosphoribosylglycinamide formyltransferase [Chloroflexota bacterium]
MTLPIAVCVSGRGSDLQALIDAIEQHRLDARIVLVASSRAGVPALERAARARVPSSVFAVTKATRSEAQAAMGTAIGAAGARLVVLAGYDRILADAFWEALGDVPVINIHPSLLPAFGGLNGMKVHEAVIAAGVSESGVTVHRAYRGKLDEGEILVQRRVPVSPRDTPETLADRVLAAEHDALVAAVRLFVPAAAS